MDGVARTTQCINPEGEQKEASQAEHVAASYSILAAWGEAHHPCHKGKQRSAHENSFHCPSGAKKATRPGQGIVRVCRWKHLQTLRLDRTQDVPHNCKQEVWVRSPNLTLRRPDKTLRARACHIPRGPFGSVVLNYGFGSTFEIFGNCTCGSVF